MKFTLFASPDPDSSVKCDEHHRPRRLLMRTHGTVREKALCKLCHVIQMLGYYCNPHTHCLVFENYVTIHGKALLSKCRAFSHYYSLLFVFVFLDQYAHNFFVVFPSLFASTSTLLWEHVKMSLCLKLSAGPKALEQHNRCQVPPTSLAGLAERLENQFCKPQPWADTSRLKGGGTGCALLSVPWVGGGGFWSL